MTDQEYYQQLLDKFKKLGFKGKNLYTQANTEFSRWKVSQQDKMLEEQLPEVTVTAPRITSSTVDNSDNTPITRRYFNTDLHPEDRAALQKGVTYDAKKARPYEREAQVAANKVGLGLGSIGLSVAAAPVVGKLASYLVPGTVGGNFIGNLAKDMLIYEGFNRGTKAITGTTVGEQVRRGLDKVSNGYIPASAKAAGPIGEVTYDLVTETPTFTLGSKVLSPMIKRVVDSAYEILPVTYNKLKNTSRSAQIAYTLNNGIRRAAKNGHIEVPETYFSDPQKAYRRTVGPTEIEDVKTIGYFRDAHESTTVPEGMLRSHGVSGWTRGYPYWSFNKKYTTFQADPKKIHSFFEVDGTGKSFNVGASGNYSQDLIPFENIAIRSAKDAARGTSTGAFGIKPGDKTILAQDANLFTINPLTGQYIYKGKVIPYKIQTYQAPTKVQSTIDPNGKIRIQLRTHTKTKPREFVLDPVGNNQYRFHQRIWDDVDKKVPGTLTQQEKNLLFQSVLDELPEGTTILPTQSTPDYLATVGTVKGRKILNRMAEADGRFVLGEPQPFQYLEDGIVKEWSTPSITKQSTKMVSQEKRGGKLKYYNK